MNFKKSIALFTALLMLVSNTGFALTIHYCGGKLASVSSGFKIQGRGEKPCCAMKPQVKQSSHKKCCSNKTVQFKGKTGVVIAKFSSLELAPLFFVKLFQKPVVAATHAFESKKLPLYYCDSHAPPRHKLYHQYIFYA